jgi:hypothetical protein
MSVQEFNDFTKIAMDASILVIDDLDKGLKSDPKAVQLLGLVGGREHATVKTFITTNMVGVEFVKYIDRFAEGLGEPIVNRLSRGFSIDFGPKRMPRWHEKLGPTLGKLERKIRRLERDETFNLHFRQLNWRDRSDLLSI